MLFRKTNCCVCTKLSQQRNNMSNSNTECLTFTVHIWDIMFARVEYLHSFWKSVVPMAKHPDQTHLRACKSSVKRYLTNVIHKPAFHFEIGVLLCLSINTL